MLLLIFVLPRNLPFVSFNRFPKPESQSASGEPRRRAFRSLVGARATRKRVRSELALGMERRIYAQNNSDHSVSRVSPGNERSGWNVLQRLQFAGTYRLHAQRGHSPGAQ